MPGADFRGVSLLDCSQGSVACILRRSRRRCRTTAGAHVSQGCSSPGSCRHAARLDAEAAQALRLGWIGLVEPISQDMRRLGVAELEGPAQPLLGLVTSAALVEPYDQAHQRGEIAC